MTLDLTISDFRRTRARIQPHIRTTPLVSSEIPNVYMKLENLQHTHAFKVRGAFAKIINLIETQDRRTILTVSAGNHGLAVARAASAFNLPCTVVVPKSAPTVKVDAIRKYGADLRLEGNGYADAENWTLRFAENTKDYVFVSPYNDRDVMLGQGSLAFEILEQLPEAATVIVPIGGGGLAAGIATVVKEVRPAVRVIGVQTEVSAAIYHSLRAGRMLTVPDEPSIADGIAGNIDIHTATFPIIQRHVNDVVLVSEAEIKAALQHLLSTEKIVAEGSAAAAIAALMAGKIKADRPTVAIITGGNIDLSVLNS